MLFWENRPPSSGPLRCKVALAAAVALLSGGSAVSQEPASSADLAPLVITATRMPTPIDEVGSAITLITATDIQSHQWRTLPDALAFVPGLNIVQTGGPGGKTSAFIRGANANHTKVIIDGIDANDPSQDGAFDFGQVLTADLGSVEVLRGPQSSLYGADALGGVINIVTRRGDGPPRMAAILEGGAYGTFNQSAGLRGAGRAGDFSFTIAHFRSADTPVTPLGLLPPGVSRIGDAYENTTLSTRLDANVSPLFNLGAVVRYVASDLRFTGDDFSVYPSVPAAAQSAQAANQIFTRGEARLDLFGGTFKNILGLAFTDYSTRLQSPDIPFGPQPPTYDKGDRLKADWQGDVTLAPGQTLVLGLQTQTDRLIDDPSNASDTTRSAFAELQSNPAKGFFAAASLRYDHDSLFGGEVTWRIAPTYRIAASGTQLKASYGTGFKAPTLTQLFVSFPGFNFFANPNLQPETSRGYDIGFEQPLGWGGLRLGATWFHNSIVNLIETNALGASYANIGRATAYGIESFASLTPSRRLSLRADYTYTLATDDLTGQELLRRPRNKATITGSWQPIDRLQMSTTVLYVGSWVDGDRSFAIPRLRAPSYFTVNLTGAYDLGRGFSLFGRIENLFDETYQDPVGFQRPGIGAFGGVRLNLGGG